MEAFGGLSETAEDKRTKVKADLTACPDFSSGTEENNRELHVRICENAWVNRESLI